MQLAAECCQATPFDCRRPCGQPLACGNHFCTRPCHIVLPALPQWQWQPGQPWQQPPPGPGAAPCELCERRCERPSRCPHPCALPCHVGDCPPCAMSVRCSCRCGKTSLPLTCLQHCEQVSEQGVATPQHLVM